MPAASRRSFWREWPLGVQLTMIVAMLVVALLAALGLLLDLWLGSYVTSSNAAQLHALADPVIARELHSPPDKPGPQPPQNDMSVHGVNLTRLARALSDQVDGPETFAMVLTPGGNVISVPPGHTGAAGEESEVSPPPRPDPPRVEVARSLASGREESEVVSSSGTRFLLLVEPLSTNSGMAGAVVLGASLARGDALRATVRFSFLIGAILGAILVGLAASRLMLLALAPLDRLVQATRRVAGGDLSVRVSEEGAAGEVGQLARAFDAMVVRLEEVFEAQRRFVADASHELRTPLTAISGMLEMLEIGADRGDPVQKGRVLRALTHEVERMARLLAGLLALSKFEGDERKSESVQLDEMVSDLRPVLEALTRDHEIRLIIENVPPVRGDRDQLEQVVVNLVENATKYSVPGGQVTATIGPSVAGDRVILQVSDTGVGIAAEALPHLFEPFYRADASRSRRTGGSGLGLAIVHSIVQAHGGKIEVASVVGKGSSFTIELPAVANDRALSPAGGRSSQDA